MAKYHAITAVGLAILELLKDARPRRDPRTDEAHAFADAEFALYQPADLLRTPRPRVERGITLYLYRVAVNGPQRNRPPRLGPDGRRYRPSLPLDLSYLLTAWAENVEVQQWLLAWAMRVLEDTLILPVGLLNRPSSEPDVFRPSETVELAWESLSLQDLVNIWDPFKQNIQPSVGLVARMVAIDSTEEVARPEPVHTRALDIGLVEVP